MKLSIHREPVLLPGGRPIDPRRLYLTLSLLGGFLTAFALGVYALYVVRDAELTPLQLVLAGTALEASAFVFEIPTGVVADAYSRRLSLVVGYVVFGLGIAIMGAVPTFAVIAGGQVVWGLGWTFLSGAREAWLADEIGEAEAAPVYLRAAQLRQIGLFLGTPFGFGLGFVSLQLPFLVGGAAFLLVAVLVALTMTEAGYRPAPAADRGTWRSMARTLGEGTRAIRGRGALIAAVVVALLLGASSEAVDRLWSFHLIEGIGLPTGISDVALFGGIALTDVAVGVAAVWLAQRTTNLASSRSITRSLLVLAAMVVAGWAVFGLAGVFWVAFAANMLAEWGRRGAAPLFVAWVNRGLDPSSRATVLSMVSQADAAGQTFGGPAMGVLASLRTVRTALVGAAVLYAPSLLVFGREARRADEGAASEEAAGD